MKQIDLISLNKELLRTRPQRMLKSKQTLIASIVASVQIPSIVLNETPIFKILGTSIIGFELLVLKKEWKKEKINDDQEIISILRNSNTYQELVEEYHKYIEDIAKLIKETGLSSSKEVLLYLHKLIQSGYFSEYMKHTYYSFKYEKDMLTELLGAKVATGKTVCRHTSSFIVDIMNTLGYTAANISCRLSDKDPVKQIQRNNVKLNHAVAGILSEDTKVLFDSTCGVFAALPQDFDFKEIESIHVSQYVTPIKKKYLIMCPQMQYINYGRDNECKTLNTTKLATITYEEVEKLQTRIDKLFKEQEKNNYDFYISHEEQIKKIKSLYQELLPYSDKRIKKHTIR